MKVVEDHVVGGSAAGARSIFPHYAIWVTLIFSARCPRLTEHAFQVKPVYPHIIGIINGHDRGICGLSNVGSPVQGRIFWYDESNGSQPASVCNRSTAHDDGFSWCPTLIDEHVLNISSGQDVQNVSRL